MSTLTVGQGQEFSTIAAAVAASQNGDVIEVQAGTYVNDFVTITDSITLQAVGGMVNVVATEPPPDLKGIFTIGTSKSAPDVTINGFSFSGNAIPDAAGDNGSGIRYQSGNLTLNDDLFYHNQMGLQATPFVEGTGTVTVNGSEFLDNGLATGVDPNTGLPGHNIYINRIASFTMTNSISEGAIEGHEVKSRALNNVIENNVIMDGSSTSSYSIDLPDGGNAIIENNLIEQGPDGGNPNIISYGEETPKLYNLGANLVVSGNAIVNDMKSASARLLWNNDPNVTAQVTNNSVWGLTSAQLVHGPRVTNGVTYPTGPVNVSNMTYLASRPTLADNSPFTQAIAALSQDVSYSTNETIISKAHANIAGGDSLMNFLLTGVSEAVNGGTGGVDVTAHYEPETVTTNAQATDIVTLLAGGTVISHGTDQITGGSLALHVTATGAATITGGGANSSYLLEGQNDVLTTTNTSNVSVRGGATAQVDADGGTICLNETDSTVRFAETGGGVNQTVTLVGGSATVTGGAGVQPLGVTTGANTGTSVLLGGSTVQVSSHGADTIFAGGAGSTAKITGLAGSTDSIQGGAGSLGYTNNGGKLVFVGGSGNATLHGGSGTMSVTAGSGNTTLFGGTGAFCFTAGSGNAVVNEVSGADSVTFGSGATSVTGGSGTDLFTFVAGQAGNDVIRNFSTLHDTLSFQGFTGDPVKSQSVMGGSTQVTLSDGTHVTFAGVSHLTLP